MSQVDMTPFQYGCESAERELAKAGFMHLHLMSDSYRHTLSMSAMGYRVQAQAYFDTEFQSIILSGDFNA